MLGADGWLRTGDIAEIDADGFVKITDRKKDIIVTAGGKNIAPQNIENDLKASKYISQALVVGDRRPYPAALVTLDEVEIGKWAEAQGIQGEMATLAADERVHHAEKGETQTLCSIPFMTPLSPTLRAVLVQLAGLDMVEACFLPNGDKSLHTEEHECETYEEMTPITPEWRQHILNELSKALTTQGDGISSEP